MVRAGQEGATAVSVVDPDGSPDDATFTIAVQPEHGTARVDARGHVAYTPDEGFVGDDVVVVAVTDGGNPDYRRTGGPVTTEVELAVTVLEAKGLGCAHASPAGAAGLLLALGLVRRRR